MDLKLDKKDLIKLSQKANIIFDLLQSKIANPKIELNFVNNFTLLIAVVLSARATDVSVNKVTKNLFQQIKTPQDLLNFGYENFLLSVKTIGLYKAKTDNIFKTANILINQYNSEVPNNFIKLIDLPGVGRKSANVILSAAFGVNTIAVDTHVNRVSKRLKFVEANANLLQIENRLMQITPAKYLKDAHNYLVLHGRYTCKAIKPKCLECILQKNCEYFKEKNKI